MFNHSAHVEQSIVCERAMGSCASSSVGSRFPSTMMIWTGLSQGNVSGLTADCVSQCSVAADNTVEKVNDLTPRIALRHPGSYFGHCCPENSTHDHPMPKREGGAGERGENCLCKEISRYCVCVCRSGWLCWSRSGGGQDH